MSSMLPPFSRRRGHSRVLVLPASRFQTIMEITRSSSTKTLQAVLKILDENRTYLAPPTDGTAGVCATNSGQMRYISGYDPTNPSKMWPTTKGVPSPAQLFGRAWETGFKSRS